MGLDTGCDVLQFEVGQQFAHHRCDHAGPEFIESDSRILVQRVPGHSRAREVVVRCAVQ